MDDPKLTTEQILLMDWVLAPQRPTVVAPAPAAPRRPLREREQRAKSWRPEFQPEFFAVPGTQVAPADVATSARMAALLSFVSGHAYAAPRNPADGLRAIARIGRAWLIRYRPLQHQDPAIPVLDFDWYSAALLRVYGGEAKKLGALIDRLRSCYGRLIRLQTGWQPTEDVQSANNLTMSLNAIWSGLAYQGLITDSERAFMVHHTSGVVAMPEVYEAPGVKNAR